LPANRYREIHRCNRHPSREANRILQLPHVAILFLAATLGAEREVEAMAKPPGAKTLVIREAIRTHPDKGNADLAELINSAEARKEDRISVTAADVNQQKQALKKLAVPANGEPVAASETSASQSETTPKKRGGRKPGPKPGTRKAASAAPTSVPAPKPAGHSRPVELLGKVFDLAKGCGGFGELKLLVDRLAGMER
jgi:hypothetical protein